jgi:hypothetical protein
VNFKIGISHRLRRFHRFNSLDAGRAPGVRATQVTALRCFEAFLTYINLSNLWLLFRNLG